MRPMKFRTDYTELPLSTEPLLEGCRGTRENLKILDYLYKHNLTDEATIKDSEGNLSLKPNCHEFKRSLKDQKRGDLIFEMLSSRDIYDNPTKLAQIKKEIQAC